MKPVDLIEAIFAGYVWGRSSMIKEIIAEDEKRASK